ncbi:HSF-type DNA-binding [Popillia japonica]|uniref:HSF-type DNA-binding n=1 Tax=Popillia japonica TaxID=7064 RepID=A0AAW1MGS9_POPJA
MQPLSENAVNVPAFLSKLWRMVNDPTTDHLISWGTGGKSFIIQNQAQFWYELLPVYYKHNNMSSFVRQLNMYGFHKMSTVDNNTMDVEKDEIKFFHPYFQKDQPDLLKLIKRKVTGTKVPGSSLLQNVKSDDLSRVLSDVKHLRGRQASVDSQLSSMKQENAVLWRELAMLRQKHMKQQQIVNKLIQFLVTIVQPSTRMGGLGVKRHFPLMLSECPDGKKEKRREPSKEGPTIHELDNSETVPEKLFEDDRNEFLQSDSSQSVSNRKKSSELLKEVCNMELNDINVDSPEYVLVVNEESNPLVDELLSDSELPSDVLPEEAPSNVNEEEDLENLNDPDDLYSNNEKIFLNSNAPDTFLTNLINGSYNSELIKDNNKQTKKDASNSNLSVAKVEYNRINSLEDLDNHVEKTHGEIDQLKDILHGCNTLDANALLGLFSDDAPDYGLGYAQNPEDEGPNKSDPLVSGSELATYNNFMDFSQLFDDSSDPQDIPQECPAKAEPPSSINTPQISNDVPLFPEVKEEKK